jgi:hypothetical protein
MKIYIAGPYTRGDTDENVLNAIDAAEAVSELGHSPFIPHLTHFWHGVHPHPYEFWLEQDMVWLRLCDAVLRLPGESGGADREVAYALDAHMPVYYRLADIPTAEDMDWRE